MSTSEQAANPIRLLLVDDKVIVREGMRAFLEQQPGFEVVGQAGSLAEAVALDVGPDVVVTDALLPDMRGNAVVGGLRSRYPNAAIFVLTDAEHQFPLDSIGAVGVSGFVAEDGDGRRNSCRDCAVSPKVCRMCSRRCASGARRPTADSRGAEADSDARERTTVGSLTAKEREVLRYLVLGHTNAEIAGLCGVSLRTVEARRARVLQKLGVRTRAELVRVAQHQGDIEHRARLTRLRWWRPSPPWCAVARRGIGSGVGWCGAGIGSNWIPAFGGAADGPGANHDAGELTAVSASSRSIASGVPTASDPAVRTAQPDADRSTTSVSNSTSPTSTRSS